MIIDSISRKILIPIVEKTAEIIANFKIGDEIIAVETSGNVEFITVCESVRQNDYVYRYGDRRASIERKFRFKELFDIVSRFAQREDFAQNIDFVECFKFALEQYGVENPRHFLREGVYAPVGAAAAAAAPVSGQGFSTAPFETAQARVDTVFEPSFNDGFGNDFGQIAA